MGIPLVDLSAQYRAIKSDIDAAIVRVIGASSFIMGREVSEFEEAFARASGARFAIGVASGTAALELVLEVIGVTVGDEVITTPLTFVATAEPIVHRGARPVFVDVDPATGNLDPARVARAVTPRTRAILPVHLYGDPADMDPLLDVARRHDLRVIEDAAQAHLARYRGRLAGTMGDAGCFSFYPGKNLGAYGDAGMVVTADGDLAARLRALRDHGRTGKYVHEVVGRSERLDALQAAILGAKLPHLEAWNDRRRRLADFYRKRLAGLPIRLPVETDSREPVYHLFVIRTERRDDLRRHLGARGIQAGIHYPVPLHLQPALAALEYRAGDFPEAERAAAEVLSLPIYPELSEEQVEEVAVALEEFFR